MIIVVDKYQKAKTILTNSSPKALGYFGDSHREQLDGLLTYEFSTLASHPSAVHLVAGNSIIVRNLDKALMKFQILRTEEEQENGKYVKRVYAENSAVGDLHGVVVKGTLLKSVGLSQAATHALQGTGWKLGRTEYAGLKDVDFSEYPTALAALYKIRDIYGLELEFTVHFDGVKVREQFVHFVKKRGQDTRKRFTYGKDLKGVTREEDRTDLVTALVGVGKADEQGNRLTFAEYEATHNGYFKPKGQDWVGDDEALQKYGNNGKHIFGRFELSSVDNFYELLEKTTAELKKVCKPRMTYAVSVVLLERLTKYPHEKVRLGDKIIVKDTTFEPALIVEARVIELVRSYTDPTEDSVVLGEFVPIFVDKNKQIEAIQQQINSNISKWEAKGETVIKSANEPTNKTPDMLWLDLNAEPNVMKRWDDTAKRWVKASATTAEEIGAETPTGAQNKADKAQDNAAKDATDKANGAIDTASKDATNKANQAKDDAVQIAGEDATNKANAAEEAAKSYADGVVESVEAAMKEHAEQVAKDAEEAAQIFTEQYAQKELHIGTTAPADTTRLWLDTTNKLNVLKRYNPTTKVWDAATPTSAAEIGAETPAGAKSKADAAQAAAKTAAEAVAKAEAALAETSAKAHADSVVTAEEERRIKQAEENLAAAKKEAADKAAAAEAAAKQAAALDATSKANAAQAAAIAEAQKKASAAETAAKTYADNIKATVDANAKQYAEERAKAAQDAAKVFTESYAQKEIKIQNTAPTDTTVLWLDTTKEPNVMKRYDLLAKKWVDASPTNASQIGAETPSGAQSKADAAKNSAVSTAAADAQSKANAAQSAAIAAAAADAKAKADAAQKAATDRANAVETSVKDFASNAGNITKGTIAADRLYGGTIDAQKANIVNINAGNIVAGTLDASKAKIVNIDAGAINVGTLNAERLAAGTITADKLHVLAKSLVANTSTTGNDSTGWNISKHASSTVALRGSSNMGDVLVHGFTTAEHDTPTLYNSNYFEVDPNQSYKFSIGMFLDKNPRDAAQYFGFTAYDKNGVELAVQPINPTNGALSGTPRTNPYFWSGKEVSAYWRSMEGYVLSSQAGGSEAPQGRNIQSSYIMHPATKFLRMRFYSGYYPTVKNVAMEVLWHSPSVTTVDSGLFTADRITAGTIDASKINVLNVNAGNVNTGTLDANKVNVTNLKAQNIVSGTLDASKVTVANLSATVLQAGIIDASKVTINNLDASKITVGTLSADKVKGGTIDANNVTINNINAGKITAGTLDASKVSVTNLNAGNITAGTLNAARIAGNSITADKILLSDFTNLCPNPDFRDGNIGGWLNGMTAVISTDASVPAGAPTKHVGRQTQRDAKGSDFFNVRPGDQFYISADMASKNSVKNATVGVYFFNKDGVAVAATNSGYKAKGTGAWQRHEGVITAPANAVQAYVWTQIDAFDTFGEWFFTNVVVRRKAGAELIVDGSITTDKITAAGISADKITTGKLDANKVAVTNLSASVIQTGVLDAAKVTVNNLSAARITSGTMSADRITGGTIDATKVNVTNLNAANINSGTLNADKVTISNGKVAINSTGVTVTQADFLMKDAKTGLISSVMPATNLINDHSFELLSADTSGSPWLQHYWKIDRQYVDNGFDGWAIVGDPYMADNYSAEADESCTLFGKKSVIVNTANYVWQDIGAKAGLQYAVSFHCSLPVGAPAGEIGPPQVAVEYVKDGTVIASEVKNFAAAPSPAGTWVRYGFTITANAGLNGRDNRIRLRFRTNNYWYTLYDGIQAVQNDKPVAYNAEDSLFQLANSRLTSVSMRLRNLLMLGNTRIEGGGLSIAGQNMNGVGLEMSQRLRIWGSNPIEVRQSHVEAMGYRCIDSRPAGVDRMIWVGWHEDAGNAIYVYISGSWKVAVRL